LIDVGVGREDGTADGEAIDPSSDANGEATGFAKIFNHRRYVSSYVIMPINRRKIFKLLTSMDTSREHQPLHAFLTICVLLAIKER
jgi:hypothetical protein